MNKKYNARRAYLSPLRYPGGKRKLVPVVRDLVQSRLRRRPSLLIEPFGGGVAVSIAMLESGAVAHVALCDADPIVGSFWATVFASAADEFEMLLKLTGELSSDYIDVPLHDIMQRFSRGDRRHSTLVAALHCLLLNRTSFSGVLDGGPIGGKSQTSRYTVDSRWNPKALTKRLRELRALRDRVVYAGVSSYDAIAAVPAVSDYISDDPDGVVWYLDPPYYTQANKLYRKAFGDEDHRRLRDFVTHQLRGHWVLSYDDAPAIRRLWKGHTIKTVDDYTYSAGELANASHGRRPAGREILLSSLFTRPRRRERSEYMAAWYRDHKSKRRDYMREYMRRRRAEQA